MVGSKPPQLPSDKYVSSRIYRNEGMIPDYNGHVHGRFCIRLFVGMSACVRVRASAGLSVALLPWLY